MKKIIKLIIITIFIASCSATNMNISREEGYKLNRKYIFENYKKFVNDSQVGFYFTKSTYEFFSLIGDDIYHLVLDVDGNLIKKESYAAYDPK
ncbi:hypothetical protein [Oceanivirga miroungae]|uniref:Lipoprotein n=1 Tax=Oceanivirga miroungae TaxID=1130046 RepID=A0A6I8M8R0_9FUSO|nr:hypothetical protein [Oceanivirga miroungae]VWL85917.1 hypothetical protein OMES3154_01202 [Oceanivirga miroungae]